MQSFMAGIVSFYSFQPLSPGVMDIGMCALHQPPNASNSGATDDAKETETLFHQMNDFSEQFSTLQLALPCLLPHG